MSSRWRRALCEPADSGQAECQIVQVLRNDVVAGKNRSLLRVQRGCHAHILLRPSLVFRHRLEKTLNVLLEVVHVGQQPHGRAFTGAKADGLCRFVDGHQINLGVGLVPVSLNSVGHREIPNALPASLLVELPREFFQSSALNVSKTLIGFFDKVVEGSKRYGRYRTRQRRKL